jgi:hypothetical protein
MRQLGFEAKLMINSLERRCQWKFEGWLDKRGRLLELDYQCQSGGLDFRGAGGKFAARLAIFGFARQISTGVDFGELIDLRGVGASGADCAVGTQVEGGTCMCLSDRQRQYEEQNARDPHVNTL